jgi:hypothetical protein
MSLGLELRSGASHDSKRQEGRKARRNDAEAHSVPLSCQRDSQCRLQVVACASRVQFRQIHNA